MRFTPVLIFVFIICILSISHAQNHNPKCPQCRFNKDYGNKKAMTATLEGCGCPVCSEIAKKETAARKAEDKRREDARLAKQKSELAAKQKALAEERAKKLAEDKAKIQASQVVINATPNPVTTSNVTLSNLPNGKTIIKSNKDNTRSVLYSRQVQDWAYLLNEAGDTILKSNEFDVSGQSWKGLNEGNNFSFTYKQAEGLPLNVAIVRFILGRQQTEFGSITDYSFGLIDSKGKKLIEENKKISSIRYCGNDFYMLVTCSPLGDCRMTYENSYGQGGYQLILFDAKLNKKYVYDAKNDLPNCKINRRVGYTAAEPADAQGGLFRFLLPACAHKENEKGFFYSMDECMEVGLDRVPRTIFVKTGRNGYMSKHAHD